MLGSLVAPDISWACGTLGVPGPFSFTVVMVEVDWDPFGFSQPPPVAGGANDLIGRKTVSFTPEELVAAMPAVGSTVDLNFILGPCVAPRVCPRGFFDPSPAEYRLTLRLTRLPDAIPRIDPNP